ncbi:unnamed protein product [Blepharisma stoltei]|uniref:Uncharacterized protein n=1 Tax=Blepharisma stoltei TaxID=1481888 RepID=A0AAU9JMU7_9CILI|nr:unnamed protein product [Blepharisma stoltei]
MPKKILLIILGCLCILYIRNTVITNRRKIAAFIENTTPSKYSSNNQEISTVSYPHRKFVPLSNHSDAFSEIAKISVKPPGIFNIDDTENLRTLGLACQPESYGYSKQQGDHVFPYHGYPKCSDLNNQTESRVYLSTEDGKIYMKCPEKFRGRLVTGPINDKKIVLRGEVEDLWEPIKYEEPLLLDEKTEFALGSCDENPNNWYKEAHMTPRFNETAYNMAKSKTKGKPKIIFMLTLDSLSRRHFFRKLPKTVDFLNSLNHENSEYWAFDFKLHNILKPNSVGNQVPIFGGIEKFVEFFEGNQNIDYLGDTALWNILREKGYISLFGLENCDNYFPRSLGRMPNFDYTVNPFFCAIYKYTDYKFDKDAVLKQRCLGPYMTHYYLLNYTDNLVRMNQGVNQWLYLHLNGGHEATGLHAETMDEDITDFLKKFLSKYSKDNEIILFLHADHGMRYGNWFKDLPAYQENKLPSLFFIARREFIDSYDKAFQILTLNTERLTSKMDLRKTLLYIADVHEDTKHGINLLKEVVPKERTCNDAGINPWDCSCTEMKIIKNPDAELKGLIERMADLLQFTINSEAYASAKHKKGNICQKIEVNEIEKVYNFQISNVEEFFKLEVSVKNHHSVKFQSSILVSSENSDRLDYDPIKYNVETDSFRGAPIKLRILTISRLDKYAGPCELKAIQAGLRGDTCICSETYTNYD